MQTAFGVLMTVAVAIVAWRWWDRKGRDVPASAKARAAMWVFVALLLPAALLGPPSGSWLVGDFVLVVGAWVLGGVLSILEHRRAKERDRELGLPARRLLWDPFAVSVVVLVALYFVMVTGIIVAALLGFMLSAEATVAMAGTIVCGMLVIAGVQTARRARHAGTGASALRFLEARAGRAAGLTTVVVGLVLIGLGTWASTSWAVPPYQSGTDPNWVLAVLGMVLPGWLVAAAGWILLRPAPPVD